MAAARDEAAFKTPVKDARTNRLQTLQASQAMDDLLPILDAGHAAIVVEGEKFLGLITRIDLLNHLRTKMR